MSHIYAIGETIFDIIFEGSRPVAARPGGAMLNTAVSLGRAGMPVSLITEISDDPVGKIIVDFLKENRVETKHLFLYKEGKTPISVAFLDEHKNASYTFYKNYPGKRLDGPFPAPGKSDMVLFGSFYSLDPAIRPALSAFLSSAKKNGAIIIHDPNIRANHQIEVRNLMSLIKENLGLADIVRGSDEDFTNIFAEQDPVEIYREVHSSGCDRLILTRGKEGTEFFSPGFSIRTDVPAIKPVSTIGAGDSFNAGIIFGLYNSLKHHARLGDLPAEEWKRIIDMGTGFAQDTCMSYDNYISVEFGKKQVHQEL
jgi:fructokinase